MLESESTRGKFYELIVSKGAEWRNLKSSFVMSCFKKARWFHQCCTRYCGYWAIEGSLKQWEKDRMSMIYTLSSLDGHLARLPMK